MYNKSSKFNSFDLLKKKTGVWWYGGLKYLKCAWFETLVKFEMCMASRSRTPIDHFNFLHIWWFSCFCLACRLISLNLEISLLTQNLVWVEQVRICSPLIFSFKILSSIFLVHCFTAFCYLVHHTGRGAKEANLYTEVAEGIYSYGITRHRHGKILYF